MAPGHYMTVRRAHCHQQIQSKLLLLLHVNQTKQMFILHTPFRMRRRPTAGGGLSLQDRPNCCFTLFHPMLVMPPSSNSAFVEHLVHCVCARTVCKTVEIGQWQPQSKKEPGPRINRLLING